jgi:DNA-binding NtrC family response regulator
MAGELMSSQLFGHVAGAFTGANCNALGCFRAAHRGTIFLDEIGELDYGLQAKLLRVLQERTVTPIGSHQSQTIDVRVIAATNRDLRSEVVAGRFREDLFYRLHVVHVQTKPLRERAEDIPNLVEAFLRQLASEGLPLCSLTARALRELVAFSWPGNVRQLRNVLEQAVIEADSAVLDDEPFVRLLANEAGGCTRGDGLAEAFDADAAEPKVTSSSPHINHEPMLPAWSTLAAVERHHLLRTLEHTFYNRSAAARLLGITRQALLRKMERHGILVPGQQR